MTCTCGKCEMEAAKVHESMEAHECDMHSMLLELADEAWMEVLKEKIKAIILATSGDHLDKIAKLVAGANEAKWTHMMSGKLKCEEYRTALKELISAGCKG